MISDTYGLSPMQQGMLYHTLCDPHAGLYIEQFIFDFPDESLNIPAFQRSWERVVARHPALRTSFRWDGSQTAVQNVHDSVSLPFDHKDWRRLPLPEQKARLEACLRSDRKNGFTLTEAPLTRLAVFRMGETHYQCVWTFHHLLSDGRSAVLILREVFSMYEALCKGEDLELPPPRSYREHINRLECQDSSRAEKFWLEALKGFTAPTPFVVDRKAIGIYDGPPAEQTIQVQRGTTIALRSLADQTQLTLNTFVQAAWALLLSRYSGEEDVVFGVTRACRRSTVEDADEIAGLFLNTVPVRARVSPGASLASWLKELRRSQIAVRDYENTPLVDVQRWSEVPPGTPLVESVLDFADFSLNSAVRGPRGKWSKRTLKVREKTNYAITIYASAEPELQLRIAYDPRRFENDTICRMLGHLKTLLESMAAGFDGRLEDLAMLSESENHQLLVEWNQTAADYPRESSVHQLIEAQVARTPEHHAVCFEDQQMTYLELNGRANQLAHHLGKRGVRPGTKIGICVERSLDMMIALLGVLKAGGAYVPLDPHYPKERLRFILRDAGIEILLTQEQLAGTFADATDRQVICLDSDRQTILQECRENPGIIVPPDSPAYLIYTSGSTGKPKGVVVRHRNVVNFFAGMNGRLGSDRSGVWLAVTSIGFDISVLELFWPLTRGFKVVIQSDEERLAPAPKTRIHGPSKKMDFSLFYFANNEEEGSKDKYRLLLEGAKFADQHGFSAVWTPERHFHAFGGLYPNPAVTGAAIAAVTKRVQIRAGSVVLPLQNPIRVAEEWSVVDNISAGRAGISFASGWHANDFVFAPANYKDRKEITFREIESVRRLWRGESLSFKNGAGTEIPVRIYPQPIQAELPIWLTCAGDPETFRMAGEMGANLLTHLLGNTIDALAQKIAIYREAWRSHGHTRAEGRKGHVTLMLHTFVGKDIDVVREKVRKPLMNYLKTSSDLVQKLAANLENDRGLKTLAEGVKELHERAFERFFQTGGLLGTPETCLAMIERMKVIGVDEIACLIDFGVDFDSVMESLALLPRVQELVQQTLDDQRDFSIPAQIARHRVTHLQCTPSLARILTVNQESAQALTPLRKLLLGGEALPPALAARLLGVVSGEIFNMYGPTETTIWSTTSAVGLTLGSVPIGRPIANTQIYILDRSLHPVPVGVPGELFIGGDGVAAGYHNRPELTAERFISDRFRNEPDARLYRTGDVARYLPDGNIEFLGRVDHQVKIRGHRIELGEIESVLQQYPGVREAVVVAREDNPGDQHLVAYVVSDYGRDYKASGLRAYLKAKLPAEMVPAAFVMLDALPRTPNGKIDRKALPASEVLERDASEMKGALLTPRDEVETELARIWERILGVHPVGVKDNFFELGGHSLLAVSLFAQVEKTFGKNLPISTLFEGPTIEQLAGLLRERGRSTSLFSPLVAIQPKGSRLPFFCVHSEGGNVMEYYPLARCLGPDQPFFALQSEALSEGYTGATLRIEDMAARYIREMRKIQPAGPYLIGGFCLGGLVAYEMAQQLLAEDEEVALVAMIQTGTVQYPRIRPDTTVFRRLLYGLIKRLDLEWSNLRALEPKARANYLAERTRVLVTTAQVKAEELADPWLVRFNRGRWHSLSYKLNAIGRLHVQAALDYTPKPYAGEGFTLFRATKQPLGIVPDSTLGWGELLYSRIEIHEIPAHHQNILKEPAVRLLAQRLTACLHRARKHGKKETDLAAVS